MLRKLTDVELVSIRVASRKPARAKVVSLDEIMIEQAEGSHGLFASWLGTATRSTA
jgi:hypothetical protein